MKTRISLWALTAFFLLKGVSPARIVAVTDEPGTTVVIEKLAPPVPTVSYTPETAGVTETPEPEIPEIAAAPKAPTLTTPHLERPRIRESKIESIAAVWVHPEPRVWSAFLLAPPFETPPLEFPKIIISEWKSVKAVWIHPEPKMWVAFLLTAPFKTPPLEFPEIIESELKRTAAVWDHPEPELKTELALFHYQKTPALKPAGIVESKIKIRRRRKRRHLPLLVPLEIGRGLKVVKGTPRFTQIRKGYSRLTAKVKNHSPIDYASVRLRVIVKNWRGNKDIFTEDILYIDSFQAHEEKEVTVIVYKNLSEIKTVSFSYADGYHIDDMSSDKHYNYQSDIKFDTP